MSNPSTSTNAPADTRPWAVYSRLSKAANGSLESVERQEELCRTYAASRGLAVEDRHVYADNSLSAWKKRVRRPAWDRLMEAAGRGELAGILVFAVDRFTRRPKDLETLIELAEDHGLAIEGPRSGRLDLTTATGRQQARWMALQAASESDNTSERIKYVLADKMRGGKPMGGGRAFGFETGGLVQRPAEVAVIREMAARLLAGEPLQHLAADMNRRGLLTVRGGEWTGANLARMLDGHRYGGKVEHKGEIVGTIPGEPILDQDTYDAVQALMASRRRGPRPTGRFMLTGLLTCSTCQRSMNGAIRHKGLADGTKPKEYRCPIQLGGCGRAVLAAPTEEIVGEHMVKLMADPANGERIVQRRKDLQDARGVALAKVQALEKQQEDLADKWARGELRDAAYNRALDTVNKRLAMAQAALDELAPPPGAARPATPAARAKAKAERLAEAERYWSVWSPEQRRAAIQAYEVRIEIGPGRRGVRRFDRDRITFP